MQKFAVLATGAVFFSGCSTTSKVMEVGPDTYSVSSMAAPVRGGTGAARSNALEQANAHCRALGKYIEVVDTSQNTLNSYGAGAADVVFRCVSRDP